MHAEALTTEMLETTRGLTIQPADFSVWLLDPEDQYVKDELARRQEENRAVGCRDLLREELLWHFISFDFFVFFANRTNSTYALNFEGNLTCLSGETPWASNGQTYWSDQGGARPVRLVRGQSGGQIPPFAFGYLKTSWDAVKDLR